VSYSFKRQLRNNRLFTFKLQTSYESVVIPQRDDVNFAYLPKRSDSCRPIGMFRSSDQEFLLCYDGMLTYEMTSFN